MSELYEKPLPSSIQAETVILGSVLLDNSLLEQAIGRLTAEDFYSPLNRRIFGAMLSLHKADKSIDPILIGEELKKEGSLESLGGITTITNLTFGLPHFPNIEEYIKVVADKATARNLVRLMNSTTGETLDEEHDVEATIDQLEQQIFKLRRTDENQSFSSIGELGNASIERVKKLTASGETVTLGLRTGLTDLDEMTSGLHKGDLIIVAGRPSMGKAQRLTSKLLTPDGWILMRDVKIGTLVCGSDGRFYPVTAIYPQGVRPMFMVRFNDHTYTETCAEHLWTTRTRNDRKGNRSGSVKSTKEIAGSLIAGDGIRLNHSVQYVEPVQFPEKDLPVAPYLLGCLIADGHLDSSIMFHNPEKDIAAKVTALLPTSDQMLLTDGKFAYRITRKVRRNRLPSQTRQDVTALGMKNERSFEKHIPQTYLFASVAQRLELLRGLIDCDGFVVSGGSVEYSTTSFGLAQDVVELVRSLGGKAVIKERMGSYTKGDQHISTRPNFRIFLSFTNDIVPVSSEKHLAKWTGLKRRADRMIESVKGIGKHEAQCITIASPDSQYVTDDFIVTHNTSAVLDFVLNATGYDPSLVIAVFELEMSKSQLGDRMICQQSRVDSTRYRRGHLMRQDYDNLTNGLAALATKQIHIDDSPKLSSMEIKARARKLRKQYGRLDLIVIDHLGLMKGSGRKEKHLELGEISKDLKAMAKDFNVPVIALCQLSRQPETRPDKRPMMSDLRQSGEIEEDADVVMMLFRDEYYKETIDNAGKAELIVGKNRNGPTGTCHLAFQKQWTHFANLHEE